MYFTSGSDRAFEQLMQGKPGFDHYDSGEVVTPEDCGTCRFYRPHWKYHYDSGEECGRRRRTWQYFMGLCAEDVPTPHWKYQLRLCGNVPTSKLTAYDAVTFRE